MWWKSKEPIKATIQACIALIKDILTGMEKKKKNPISAGVAGAARLEDFEWGIHVAPEKP